MQNITKPKDDSAYSDKIQVAISGTKHAVTIADNRTLYRKHTSKPISELRQAPKNRGTGFRRPDGRFVKSPKMINIQDSDSDLGDASPATPTASTPDYGKTATTSQRSGTLERGRSKLIRNRQSSDFPGESLPQTDQQQKNMGPLTIVAEKVTNAEVDRVIEDVRRANTERHVRDKNRKVSQSNYKTPNTGKKTIQEK